MTDKRKAIAELQQALRDIAKTDRDIISVIPDGIFAEETEEAVKSFQRKYGFTETGIVDFELWEKIQEEKRRSLFILSDPIQVISIKNEDLPLSLGQVGKAVHTLNLMLSQLGELYDNFSAVNAGDEFTEKTLKEVKKWQQVIGHEISGEVDKLTWNRLAQHYLLPLA